MLTKRFNLAPTLMFMCHICGQSHQRKQANTKAASKQKYLSPSEEKKKSLLSI